LPLPLLKQRQGFFFALLNCNDIVNTIQGVDIVLYRKCHYIPFMATTPQKRRGSRKADYMQLRLAPDEKRAFNDAADIAGVSLSTWVRERLRRVARRELEEANHPIAFLNKSSQ
jgi:hypothetical protein